MSHVTRVLSLALFAGLLFTVAACDNTIRGVGEDLRESGQAIEDAAS